MLRFHTCGIFYRSDLLQLLYAFASSRWHISVEFNYKFAIGTDIGNNSILKRFLSSRLFQVLKSQISRQKLKESTRDHK